MTESVVTTLQIILIVFDILILLSLVVYTFKGFRKGFIQTSLVLASRIVPLLLMLLFVKPIGKGIIHAEIPYSEEVLTEEISISGIVKTEVAKNYFNGNINELFDTKLDILIDDVLISLVGIFLYIIFAILVFLIVSPLIRLIFRLSLPFAKQKKHNILSRILGAGLGACSYLVLFVVLLLPIYGALETGKVILNETAVFDSQMNQAKEYVNEITDKSIILNLTSNFGKKKEGKFGIGAKYLGQNVSIRTEYGNINPINELDNLGAYLPRAIELFKEFTEGDKDINEKFDQINESDIDSITLYLSKSKIIKVAYPAFVNVLKVKEDKFDIIAKSNIDYDELLEININKDFQSSKDFLLSILNIVKRIDLQNFNIDVFLLDENLPTDLSNAISEGFNLEIAEKFLSKLLICYLDDVLKENKFEHLVGIMDNNYLKNGLSYDILALVDIYKTLEESDVLAYFKNEIDHLEITDELRNSLNGAIDQIFGLKLLENQEKKLVQTAFMFTDFDSDKLEQMLNENINWHQEVESVSKMAVNVFELIIEAKLHQNDSYAVLESDHILTILTKVIDETFQMQLAEKYFVPLAIEYLEDYLAKNDLSEFIGLIGPDYLKNSFTSDFNILVTNYKILKETKILEYFQNKEQNQFIVTPELETKLQNAIDGILEMKLVENNEKVFIRKILSFLPKDITIDIEQMMSEQIDWKEELNIFSKILKETIILVVETNFNQEDVLKLMEDEKARVRIPVLIEQIFMLQTSEKYFANVIDDYLSQMLLDTNFSNLVDCITPKYLKNDFVKDIQPIFDIYDLTKELKLSQHFDDNDEYRLDLRVEENENKFRSFTTKVLSLYLIQNHEEAFIKRIFELTHMDKIISLDHASFDGIDWESEKTNLVDISVELIHLSNIDNVFSDNYLNETNYLEISNQMARTFDAMAKSSVTNEYVFQILDEILKGIDYTIALSDDDKNQIINNTAVFEFNILTNVSKQCQEVFKTDFNGNIDYNQIDGNDIASLMITSSDGVIASKLLGQMLNDILGPNGLNMIPLDKNTNLPFYDFTISSVLKSQAISIGNTYNLVKNLKDFDIHTMNMDNIDNLKNSIALLENSDVNNKFVEEVLNTFVNSDISVDVNDKTDWQIEANTVAAALEAYQNSPDKENFDIADDEVLNNLVNESDVAKVILKYFGLLK